MNWRRIEGQAQGVKTVDGLSFLQSRIGMAINISKSRSVILPMLNIVGVSASEKTFNVAFMWLSQETESFYIWAMETFRSAIDL